MKQNGAEGTQELGVDVKTEMNARWSSSKKLKARAKIFLKEIELRRRKVFVQTSLSLFP